MLTFLMLAVDLSFLKKKKKRHISLQIQLTIFPTLTSPLSSQVITLLKLVSSPVFKANVFIAHICAKSACRIILYVLKFT